MSAEPGAGPGASSTAAAGERYANMTEVDALKLVTINPAIQLHVQDKVGSLEPGKDADFVIWNGHPLSNYSLAEQTWIDGRKYFDRAADLAARKQLADERAALIAKTKDKAKQPEKGGDAKTPAYLLWSDNEDATCHEGLGHRAGFAAGDFAHEEGQQ